MPSIDIDKEDLIETTKYDPTKGIIFNIIKYGVASLPIVIPFVVLMYVTNYDIFISVVGTVLTDLLIIISLFVYAFKKYGEEQNNEI